MKTAISINYGREKVWNAAWWLFFFRFLGKMAKKKFSQSVNGKQTLFLALIEIWNILNQFFSIGTSCMQSLLITSLFVYLGDIVLIVVKLENIEADVLGSQS